MSIFFYNYIGGIVKKIREKFTIVERLIFYMALMLIIIIIIPIISDKIEKPKRDTAKLDTDKYIEIVNNDIKSIKEIDEGLYNELLKYNSLSKYCSITDSEEQILSCGEFQISVSSENIKPEIDSVIYFSSGGVVAGYKIIVDNYKVIYPNTKGLTTIKRYKKPKEKETVELKSS